MNWHIKNASCEWNIGFHGSSSNQHVFSNCCKTCNKKQAAPKKGVIIKPIISDGFNMRGQVDLIDF